MRRAKHLIINYLYYLAIADMISNVSVSNVTSSGSDCDMLEGSEEGDDVCSQGKKHSRRSICT